MNAGLFCDGTQNVLAQFYRKRRARQKPLTLDNKLLLVTAFYR
jgi:hypothetical protein